MLSLFVVFLGCSCGNSNKSKVSDNNSNDYKIESCNMAFDNEEFIVKYPKVLGENKDFNKIKEHKETVLLC